MDQTVGVLIGDPLPGCIRISKVKLSVELVGNSSVRSKFLAVIRCDGCQVAHPAQQVDHSLSNPVSALVTDLTHQGEARFPFIQSDQSALMTFTNQSVHFLPISQAFAPVNDLRTCLNASPGRYFASAVITTIPFAALFLAAQVFIKITTALFIDIRVLVDGFMAHVPTSWAHGGQVMAYVPTAWVLESPRDLFGTPVQAQFAFDQPPHFCTYSVFDFVLSPPHRFIVGLAGTVSSLPAIAQQFLADGRFVNAERCSHLSLGVLHFQKCLYLVSLFPGKLGVGCHKRYFDLSVSEPILPQLASFNRFKVALRVEST